MSATLASSAQAFQSAIPQANTPFHKFHGLVVPIQAAVWINHNSLCRVGIRIWQSPIVRST